MLTEIWGINEEVNSKGFGPRKMKQTLGWATFTDMGALTKGSKFNALACVAGSDSNSLFV